MLFYFCDSNSVLITGNEHYDEPFTFINIWPQEVPVSGLLIHNFIRTIFLTKSLVSWGAKGNDLGAYFLDTIPATIHSLGS